MSSHTPELSIIIVTYNPGEIFFLCLESLRQALIDLPTEILVIDNNSTDGIVEQATLRYPEFQLIKNSDNKGFAGANNQGLAMTKADYVLLLNPDTIIRGDALQQMLSLLKAQPKVGMTGPRIFHGNGDLVVSAFGPFTPYAILGSYLALHKIIPSAGYRKHHKEIRYATQPFEVSWIQGCAIMLRHQVYEQIGGLDENLFLFCEEPDFCLRATRGGWKVMFNPKAEIEHHESTSVSRYPLVKMRYYHISPLYYFRKWGSWIDVLILKIGFTFELVLKFLIRLFQFTWLKNPLAKSRLLAYPVVLGEIWKY